MLKEIGGAESRPLFIAEALKNDYDVTLICTEASELEKLNEFYGTRLKPNDVSFLFYPLPPILRQVKFASAFKSSLFAYYCRKKSQVYDLIITSFIGNFKNDSIQFVKDLTFSDDIWREYCSTKKSFLYKNNLIRKFYIEFNKKLRGNFNKSNKKIIFVANSKWTSKILKNSLNLRSSVIYPPVNDFCSETSLENRQDSFLYIGRLSPEKRVENVIEILQKVRNRGWSGELLIIGGFTNIPYVNKLLSYTKIYGDWIKFLGAKYKKDKQKLLNKCNYGINAMPNEPFGIAIAEMVKAGLIVWVPDGGGQKEIVDHPDLIYKNEHDAVAKIENVLKNPDKQKSLLKHLKNQSKKFSTNIFMLEIKKLVNEFFKKNEEH